MNEYYEVKFMENNPPGIVLQRSIEKTIAQISNYTESALETGSMLISVNGVLVESFPYQDTIAFLKQW